MLGAALPVAAKPMYRDLGVGWATSLVGFVSLACVPIPYVLLWKGRWVRERSRFCQMLVKEGVVTERSGGVQNRNGEEC